MRAPSRHAYRIRKWMRPRRPRFMRVRGGEFLARQKTILTWYAQAMYPKPTPANYRKDRYTDFGPAIWRLRLKRQWRKTTCPPERDARKKEKLLEMLL